MGFRRLSVGWVLVAWVGAGVASAQQVRVWETTPDLLEALAERPAFALHEVRAQDVGIPQIRVDSRVQYQQVDGFGASLTDAAGWLFANKLGAPETDAVFHDLFSRDAGGLGLGFLRQPVGASDLSVTFYSLDDMCEQGKKACVAAAGVRDDELARFSLAHDEAYLLPLLRKARALNPALKVMLTAWSAPEWMKTTGSMLGKDAATKTESHLRPDAYGVYARYLARTIAEYGAAGVRVDFVSAGNEPLYTPEDYPGMAMTAKEQARFLGEALGPELKRARLDVQVLAWDHNWDHPEFPEEVLRDPKANAVVAGTAWHHYEGDLKVMTKLHDEFPAKGTWVTESSGGTWQKGLGGGGNVLAEEAAELIGVMRNWSRSYVLWSLANDEKRGPVIGGCDSCRGLLTIDGSGAKPVVRRNLDYYVLGQASRFVLPGAVRVESDQAGDLQDVAFRNRDGSLVLYMLNTAAVAREFCLVSGGWQARAVVAAGSVATFVWKP